jgi:hypothetical protein
MKLKTPAGIAAEDRHSSFMFAAATVLDEALGVDMLVVADPVLVLSAAVEVMQVCLRLWLWLIFCIPLELQPRRYSPRWKGSL